LENLRDLIINGNGSSGGGDFETVKINGHGKIHGDIKCDYFNLNGHGGVEGNVIAQKIQMDGSGKIKGNVNSKIVKIDGHTSILGMVEAERLDVDGHATVTGTVTVKELDIDGWVTIENDTKAEDVRVDGRCKVKGNLLGKEVRVDGMLTVQGNCEAELFKGDGKFDIAGLLSADQIDINIYWNSKSKEIGGQSIIVKRRSELLNKLVSAFKNVQLTADLIEGDYVELNSTKVKIVRGEDVVIGDNCDIDLVEYSGTYLENGSSTVRKAVKI
jgi:cytoskeletal protein CcmA (bactofilin family)